MKLRAKISIGCVVAVLAAVGWVLFVHHKTKHAVDAYKAELRAKGEKLDWTELAPKPPSGDLNGAGALMGLISITRAPTSTVPSMKIVGPGAATVGWQLPDTQPARKDEGWTNVWTNLLAELQDSREGLDGLHDALEAKVIFFGLDYSQGMSLLLPHLTRLKQAEIMTSAASRSAMHERNYGEAWTNLIMSVDLVRKYRAEPIIISQLVRIAMAAIALGVTWDALQSDQFTEPQLAELQEDWAAMNLFEGGAPSLAMERATFIKVFVDARESYAALRGATGGGGGSPTMAGVALNGLLGNQGNSLEDFYDRYPRYWGWKNSWSYDEEKWYVESVQTAIEACRSAEKNDAFVPELKKFDSEAKAIMARYPNSTNHFLLTLGMDAMAWRSVLKYAEAETSRRMVVTAIALKRYKMLHGKYPSSLTELTPDLLRKMPIDFMDGKPLRYHLKEDGTYLLYSTGDDGVDNGGDVTPGEPTATRAVRWLKGRDAVWPRPATPEEVNYYYTNSVSDLLPSGLPPRPR